jgi:chemotaxis protein methyltransferase CheR
MSFDPSAVFGAHWDGSVHHNESDPLALSHKSFERFAQFITGKLGIKMSEAKVPMLQSRLMRRLRELRIGSLEEYQQFLFNSPGGHDELVHFIDAITTNKTDFFREPQHFEYLVNTALANVNPGRGVDLPWRLNLWCAGCSSGEEPYTLAMVLGEYARGHPGFDFSILATDISTRMLDHAQAGIYDAARIEPVAAHLRQRWLLRSNDPERRQVRVVPELRSKLSFHRLNFMDADYALKQQFDIIFFRNVMIYFDKETQEAVLQKQCRNLKPGGYLFVGHSESLAGLNVPLSMTGSAVFRRNS